MGQQRTFTSSPDHVGIYHWITTEAKKPNSHRSSRNENILGLIGDITGILYCKHQIHNWLTEGKQDNTKPGGTANPKPLTRSRAGRCRRGEVAPEGKAALGGLQDKLQLTTPWDNRRNTHGDHIIPSQNTQQPDPAKLLGQARGRNKISELELIWIRDSWAAIEYKLS